MLVVGAGLAAGACDVGLVVAYVLVRELEGVFDPPPGEPSAYRGRISRRSSLPPSFLVAVVVLIAARAFRSATHRGSERLFEAAGGRPVEERPLVAQPTCLQPKTAFSLLTGPFSGPISRAAQGSRAVGRRAKSDRLRYRAKATCARSSSDFLLLPLNIRHRRRLSPSVRFRRPTAPKFPSQGRS